MSSDDAAKRREQEIERYAVLDGAARRELSTVARLAADVCGVSGSTLTVDVGARQHDLVSVGTAPAGAACGPRLPEQLLEHPGPLVVDDVTSDERFAGHAVGDERFHASVPLDTSGGVTIGRLCVLDTTPRDLSPTQLEVLDALGRRAVGVLELAARSRDLDDCRAEVAEADQELRRAREHLSLFAGQVSHDLRTPLTAVGANAEMLSTEPAVTGDADLTWMVDGIMRAAGRMNAMIEQVLDYAREGGVPSTAAVDLDTVFDLALADLAPEVSGRGAEVTVGHLPTVSADAAQMHTVAVNLLSNALRFSRPDVAPCVVVAAERSGEHWQVSVTDNGIGVAPEKQEAMFVLFARADKRTGGAGLGLAMCRRIVEAHGGRMGMQAAGGGGTTVWFRLPA